MSNKNTASAPLRAFTSKNCLLQLTIVMVSLGTLGMTLTRSVDVNAQPTLAMEPGNEDVTELIILYNDKSSPRRATSNEILGAVGNPSGNVKNASLSAALSFPVSARHVIQNRHSYDEALLVKDAKNADADSPAIALQKYVVLKYPSAIAAQLALAKLKNDPNILWAGINSKISLSAMPADPYLAFNASLYNYQWALRPGATQSSQPGFLTGVNGINAFAAADNVRGHAYI